MGSTSVEDSDFPFVPCWWHTVRYWSLVVKKIVLHMYLSMPSTCVGSDVFLERTKSRKHLFTLPTLVRFILTVYRQMDFEVRGACKAPAALLTLKWLLS